MIKISTGLKYGNKRAIFRILLSDNNKVLVEERDKEIKQAFFSCIDTSTNKTVCSNVQPFEEKYWVGVETFFNDLIIFHKFAKPDMPVHRGVFAYDVNEKRIIWQNEELSYLFIHDDKLYAYKQKFESADILVLDAQSGSVIEDMSTRQEEVNELGRQVNQEAYNKGYVFPEIFSDSAPAQNIRQIIDTVTSDLEISGKIEYTVYKDSVFMNYFTPNSIKKLDNIFLVIDIISGKIIFKEILDIQANAYVPDSFFIKEDLLFILKGRTELLINKIK